MTGGVHIITSTVQLLFLPSHVVPPPFGLFGWAGAPSQVLFPFFFFFFFNELTIVFERKKKEPATSIPNTSLEPDVRLNLSGLSAQPSPAEQCLRCALVLRRPRRLRPRASNSRQARSASTTVLAFVSFFTFRSVLHLHVPSFSQGPFVSFRMRTCTCERTWSISEVRNHNREHRKVG